MGGRDRIVDAIVLQQLVRCLNEQQLQDAFDNDLLEDTASCRGCQWPQLLLAVAKGRLGDTGSAFAIVLGQQLIAS